jgi:DNA-binding CsgD family transcriptional regulator
MLDAAGQALVLEWQWLADRWASCYSRSVPWVRDDLKGAARLGLVEAAARHRPGMQAWPDYAEYRIRLAIRREQHRLGLRRRIYRTGRISLPCTSTEPWALDSRPAATPAASGPEPDLGVLTPRQQAAVRLVVIEGCGYRDAADRLGRSVATVHQLVGRGLDRLRLNYA